MLYVLLPIVVSLHYTYIYDSLNYLNLYEIQQTLRPKKILNIFDFIDWMFETISKKWAVDLISC